ncbi:MAG: TRAP transporter substrate-binding protein [Peptococcaceae bacterium]|jgi:tripartite ATP-independent transporter DctP family solute receptor|nr:TRAP transporter substrate-binding protein [Peptococcaceae bacterium]
MKKSMLASIAVILLMGMLVLSACGGSSSAGGGTAPASSGGASSGASGGAAAGTGTPAAPAFEKQVLKMGTSIFPVNGVHIHYQAMELLKEEIEKATNGLIEIELYHSGQLGTERDLVEGLENGTFQLGYVYSVLGTMVEDYNIYDMPFLFKNMDHFAAVSQSDIARDMGKKLEAFNLKYISQGSASNPFHLSNNVREIHTVADVNGLKIRAQESPFFLETLSTLGAQAVPMAWGEVYTALQQGVIDGVTTIYTGYYTAKVNEVQKYLSELSIFYSPAWCLANMDWWNSLPEEIQQQIQEGADKAMVRHYADNVKQDGEMKDLVKDSMIITEPADIDMQGFIDAVQPMYVKYDGQYGDLLNAIKAMGDNL